ncbi:type 1 fimbrial protein [Pseudomonas sp. KCJK9016]|uniref:type 1 fimbrial protein n=1 Tax=Pseudomonas sp. KCJK9016 TaxID=3344556 RepID=UPI003906B112
MKLKAVLSIVLVLLPFSAYAAPQIATGVIRFTGQIVDPGCAVGRVGTLGVKEARPVEVRPGLTLDVDTYRNACSRKALPLSVSYKALKATTDMGIVTVSYQ